MDIKLLKDALGWGLVLWLIGYVLGLILFFLVPPQAIGWVIMPLGITITVWVSLRRIDAGALRHYMLIGVAWALIAVICDYLFLVKLLHPSDGYYKLDIYLYYALTLFLPIVVGSWKQSKQG